VTGEDGYIIYIDKQLARIEIETGRSTVPGGVSGGHVLGGLARLGGRLLGELLEDEALSFAAAAEPGPAAVRALLSLYLFLFLLLLLL